MNTDKFAFFLIRVHLRSSAVPTLSSLIRAPFCSFVKIRVPLLARQKNSRHLQRRQRCRHVITEIKNLLETAQNSIYSGRAKDARGMNLNILLTHVETLLHSIAQLD